MGQEFAQHRPRSRLTEARIEVWSRRLPVRAAVAILVAAGALVLYVSTLAPGTIFGDPSEYQFIPAIWGIAHPPGYALYTLLAGLWQRVIAVGSVAYRTNLLAACLGAWTVSRVALISAIIVGEGVSGHARRWTGLAAVVAGGALALAPDLWQQSIHANAHILSVAITSTQLWVLLRWYEDDRTGWLYGLAFLVGLGVAHHPITVWGVPAYGLFILLHRPRVLLRIKTLALGLVSGLAGLLPWLYFPLRSPSVPFGPTDMATWKGFLRHATAQGLRVNLFHFGLADQADRGYVFLQLLHLQYGWVLLGFALLGTVFILVERPRIGVLWLAFLLGHLGFTMNSVQDVMAYLLHAFAALAVPVGVGALVLLRAVDGRGRLSKLGLWPGRVALVLPLVALGVRGVQLYPDISLRNWRVPDAFVAELAQRFAGTGAGAALVSDWEHLTPYFYHTYVVEQPFSEADLRPVYVTGATPWVDSVFANLPLGPTYLTNYRRDIRELGFRLRPVGSLWQVLEPPAVAPVAPDRVFDELRVDDALTVVGVDLPTGPVAQGEAFPIVIYASVATTETRILMPYALLGDIEQRWTTDSRRLTPEWLPGEIIAEVYQVFVPYDLTPGRYPLQLGYVEMGATRRALTFSTGDAVVSLGTVEVAPAIGARAQARVIDRALANLGNDVALVSVRARRGTAIRWSAWDKPIEVRPGDVLHLTLGWDVLARPRTSYTVFIHLIDASGQSWLGHDYTPLGGAFPSYLWFPKWLPGQRVEDPYRLTLPKDIPPGTYWLEVGLYEMGTIRRVPQLAADGTMTGDRRILGPVQVGP